MTVVPGNPGATLVYWCNNGLFTISWYFACFQEALYSSWRGWARLLLHCLRNIAGNSSGPPEEFCEIVLIVSMISSLVILMSECISLWVFKEVICILNRHRWVRSAEDAIVLFIQ